MLSPEILVRLKQADKLPYTPRPREFIRRAPTRALMILVDGITPAALQRAHGFPNDHRSRAHFNSYWRARRHARLFVSEDARRVRQPSP
jgi:hypothetical protein